MAASRNHQTIDNSHFTYLFNQQQFSVFFQKEHILAELKEAELSFPNIMTQRYTRLIQQIQYAALYIMRQSADAALDTIIGITPGEDLPTEFLFACERSELSKVLEQTVNYTAINRYFDTYSLYPDEVRFTNYVGLYKDAFSVFKFIDLALDPRIRKKETLHKFIESRTPTLRAETNEKTRMTRKLKDFTQKVRAQTGSSQATSFPQGNIISESVDVLCDWIKMEDICQGSNDNLMAMDKQKRENFKLSLLFILQLIDNAYNFFFSNRQPYLKEILQKNHVVKAELHSDNKFSDFTITFDITNPQDGHQRKIVTDYLKLDLIAKTLGAIVKSRTPKISVGIQIFTNAYSLYNYFQYDIEKQLAIVDNKLTVTLDNSELTPLPTYFIESFCEPRQIDNVVVDKLWQIHLATEQKLNAQKRREKTKKVLAPSISTRNESTYILTNEQKSPSPQEKLLQSLQQTQQALQNSLQQTEQNYRNLQSEYRSLFRTYQNFYSCYGFTTIAATIEAIEPDLEQSHIAIHLFTMPHASEVSPTKLDAYQQQQDNLMHITTTIQKLRDIILNEKSILISKIKKDQREYIKGSQPSIKPITALIQEKLAEKKQTTLPRRTSRTGLTPQSSPLRQIAATGARLSIFQLDEKAPNTDQPTPATRRIRR